MSKLSLYYYESCPYCRKVINFMDINGIEIEMKDISRNREYSKELLAVGGKYQVPCLFIDGQPLYESADIIDWFKENLKNPERSLKLKGIKEGLEK